MSRTESGASRPETIASLLRETAEPFSSIEDAKLGPLLERHDVVVAQGFVRPLHVIERCGKHGLGLPGRRVFADRRLAASRGKVALHRDALAGVLAAEVLLHELTREAVDAGGHRGVGGEDGAGPDDLEGLRATIERAAAVG